MNLQNIFSINFTVICIILVFIVNNSLAGKAIKTTKIKNDKIIVIRNNVNQKLTNEEIDPNISPSPLPVNDDSVVTSSAPMDNNSELNNNVNNNSPNNDVSLTNTDTVSETITDQLEQNPPINEDDQSPINKYCDCSETECNCCRDFKLPIVPVRGPGCAKIRYLGNEKVSVSIKYGDITLASRVISGKKAQPICVPLPGGFSSFCGRIYGLRKESNDFKACLGLELRAEEEIEAALRVSCFKFGSKGLQLAEAEPLPPIENEKDEDDYDFFGLGGDDDDDDDENDDVGNENANDGQSDEADYEGFSLLGTDLLDGIFGGDDSNRRR